MTPEVRLGTRPITHMALPKGHVLEITTVDGDYIALRLGKAVQVELEGRNYGAVVRKVDVLRCPNQYGPLVVMCALGPDNAFERWTPRQIIEQRLTALALFPGAAVCLIDTNAPRHSPITPFVIRTVSVA